VSVAFSPELPATGDATCPSKLSAAFGKRLTDKEAFSRDLPAIVAEDLGAAAGLLRILATLEG
jgi:hypothetical protein